MGIYQKAQKWFIDYRYQGRRIRECVGPSKRMAEQALAARKGEIVQERYQMGKRGEVRFKAFANIYLDYAKTDKRSWARDETSLKKLLPFFGSRLLCDIHPLLIQSYKEKRLREVKPATVNRELGLLKHMYNLGIKWGRVSTNPMRDVRLLYVKNVQERVLSLEEAAKLLGACTEYSRPIVLTALNTGMRRGEILGLKWEHIDTGQRVITILNSKNGKVRKIPINDTLWWTLEQLKKNATTEFVFVCLRTGKPSQRFTTAWLNALRRSGITHCRFHDLRHTFASNLVAAGVDLITVQELMGHSTILMTSRYAHSAPERKRQAVASLESRVALHEASGGHHMDTGQKTQIFKINATN